MPTYTYRARDPQGRLVRGALEAPFKEELIKMLHQRGYLATQVAESLPRIRWDHFVVPLEGVPSDQKLIFFVELAQMLGAGIPLLQCLVVLSAQVESGKLRAVLGDVARRVEGGMSFSDALGGYPGIFTRVFVSMARVGEATGKLDVILARYASFFEAEIELRRRIGGALLYPFILLGAGLFIVLAVVTFVVPQFAEIFLNAGVKLPLPTQILYVVGTALKRFWPWMMGAGFLGGALFGAGLKSRRGRRLWDGWKLSSPVLGPLHRKISVSRFCRMLSLLLSSGVPAVASLEVVEGVLDNSILGDAVFNTRRAVERGERIAENLKLSGLFPQDVVQMIAIGEESGRLDVLLERVSDFYDTALRFAVQRLTVLMESLFLVIMGSLIGLIMASMLLPIFDMIKILRNA